TYTSVPGPTIDYDDMDFDELRAKGLIHFKPVDRNTYRGKPTELGITIVQRSLAAASPNSEVTPNQPLGLKSAHKHNTDPPPSPNDQSKPSLDDVKAALNQGDHKLAVKLRCTMDGCKRKDLWGEAFQSRRGTESTKQTAFNRWHASRRDTPSWADGL